MAGTNDYYNNGDAYFRSTDFPTIMSDIAAAVDQFYAYAGNADKYLVISTLPPKARGGVSPEYASFLNEGYSIVAGSMVAGNAHNGTYTRESRPSWPGCKAQHTTLVLFENPITDMSELSLDLIHFTDVGYQKYAAALHATLEAEIGLSSGGIGEVLESLADGDRGDRRRGRGPARGRCRRQRAAGGGRRRLPRRPGRSGHSRGWGRIPMFSPTGPTLSMEPRI